MPLMKTQAQAKSSETLLCHKTPNSSSSPPEAQLGLNNLHGFSSFTHKKWHEFHMEVYKNGTLNLPK